MVDLISNLDRSLFTPFCVVSDAGELTAKLTELDCKWFAFRRPSFKPKNALKLFRTVRHIQQLVAEHNIHIVHSDFERDAILFGYATRKMSTKAIWHCRVAGSNKHDNLAVRLSDDVVCISKGVVARIEAAKTSASTHVIYNGVNTNLFTPTTSQVDSPYLRLGGSNLADRVVLFVGQLKRGKGIFELLECAKRQPESLFVFIGSYVIQTDKNEFKQQTSGVDNVYVIPQQDNIVPWMQHARTLVLPSHEGVEGMGRVLFEAMACGIPVIGSDTSGVREALDERCGKLVPERDVDALHAAIHDIVNADSEVYESMSVAARNRATEVFASEVHATKVMALYNEMVRT